MSRGHSLFFIVSQSLRKAIAPRFANDWHTRHYVAMKMNEALIANEVRSC